MDTAIPGLVAKLVVFAGPASSGKSSVIKWLTEQLSTAEQSPAYVRVYCHEGVSESPPVPSELARAAVSGRVCPDHFLAAEAGKLIEWAEAKADLLLVETAGLCARCSPFPEAAVGVFVADLTTGRSAIKKVGPMLATADVCVLTRIDRVSAAETAMATLAARRMNSDCAVIALNGLTGEGAIELAAEVRQRVVDVERAEPGPYATLRASPPQFYCSYCMGQHRVAVFES
jgi:Ni2+-binding GTPase involved in maturation of urease and hydrogenase